MCPRRCKLFHLPPKLLLWWLLCCLWWLVVVQVASMKDPWCLRQPRLCCLRWLVVVQVALMNEPRWLRQPWLRQCNANGLDMPFRFSRYVFWFTQVGFQHAPSGHQAGYATEFCIAGFWFIGGGVQLAFRVAKLAFSCSEDPAICFLFFGPSAPPIYSKKS